MRLCAPEVACDCNLVMFSTALVQAVQHKSSLLFHFAYTYTSYNFVTPYLRMVRRNACFWGSSHQRLYTRSYPSTAATQDPRSISVELQDILAKTPKPWGNQSPRRHVLGRAVLSSEAWLELSGNLPVSPVHSRVH